MIIAHQKFELNQKCLIEKVIIQAPFRFITNFQDEACFIYFTEGNATINASHEQQEVKSGESILLRCGTYFTDLLKYSKADRLEALVFHLSPALLRRLYQNEIPEFVKQSQRNHSIQKIQTVDVINRFIESLYFYFENPKLVSEELLELKVKELILLLIQTNNADSVVSLFSDIFTPRNLNIKEVVNNHLFSSLSIEDLATLSNLSVSTFNRTFQRIYNTSPANYIKVKRLERARELLTVSTLTVNEIAFQTCFNDAAHFSRSFKSSFKCSPKEYRASLKS